MPAQTPAVQNYNALIKHHIRQLAVIPDIGGLHQYAVFDFCTLADMNSAEKHGIFDFTLDYAAVRNNAVARTAAAAVIRGHLILDFCINRVRGIEQILLHSGLKQRKIMLIKCIV